MRDILYRKRRRHEATVEDMLENLYLLIEQSIQERRDQYAYPREVRVIEPRRF